MFAVPPVGLLHRRPGRRQCVLPSTSPVQLVRALDREPVYAPGIAEPGRRGAPLLVDGPGALERTELDERGGEVRAAADQRRGARGLGNLDRELEIGDPVHVATADAGQPAGDETLGP
jgi:hypothetical protein